MSTMIGLTLTERSREIVSAIYLDHRGSQSLRGTGWRVGWIAQFVGDVSRQQFVNADVLVANRHGSQRPAMNAAEK